MAEGPLLDVQAVLIMQVQIYWMHRALAPTCSACSSPARLLPQLRQALPSGTHLCTQGFWHQSAGHSLQGPPLAADNPLLSRAGRRGCQCLLAVPGPGPPGQVACGKCHVIRMQTPMQQSVPSHVEPLLMYQGCCTPYLHITLGVLRLEPGPAAVPRHS